MKLKELLARQKEIIDNAKKHQRNLTEDEQKEFDGLQKQIDEINASIKNQQTPSQPNNEDSIRAAIEAERQRVSNITSLCRAFGYDDSEYIAKGNTIDQVREFVLEKKWKKENRCLHRLR